MAKDGCYPAGAMSILNLFMRRIPPSSPPVLYCAKCGRVVNPGAWDCPRCGVSLRGEGATTGVAPSLPGLPPEGFPAQASRSQPAISRSSIIGLIVLALTLALYLIFKKAGA
ncbi:MAG TPA: hypothetical protein VGS10_06115 [Terracidiphilus sp.]|nr:hypothetical protein [Terracidiphilus sp.]